MKLRILKKENISCFLIMLIMISEYHVACNLIKNHKVHHKMSLNKGSNHRHAQKQAYKNSRIIKSNNSTQNANKTIISDQKNDKQDAQLTALKHKKRAQKKNQNSLDTNEKSKQKEIVLSVIVIVCLSVIAVMTIAKWIFKYYQRKNQEKQLEIMKQQIREYESSNSYKYNLLMKTCLDLKTSKFAYDLNKFNKLIIFKKIIKMNDALLLKQEISTQMTSIDRDLKEIQSLNQNIDDHTSNHLNKEIQQTCNLQIDQRSNLGLSQAELESQLLQQYQKIIQDFNQAGGKLERTFSDITTKLNEASIDPASKPSKIKEFLLAFLTRLIEAKGYVMGANDATGDPLGFVAGFTNSEEPVKTFLDNSNPFKIVIMILNLLNMKDDFIYRICLTDYLKDTAACQSKLINQKKDDEGGEGDNRDKKMSAKGVIFGLVAFSLLIANILAQLGDGLSGSSASIQTMKDNLGGDLFSGIVGIVTDTISISISIYNFYQQTQQQISEQKTKFWLGTSLSMAKVVVKILIIIFKQFGNVLGPIGLIISAIQSTIDAAYEAYELYKIRKQVKKEENKKELLNLEQDQFIKKLSLLQKFKSCYEFNNQIAREEQKKIYEQIENLLKNVAQNYGLTVQNSGVTQNESSELLINICKANLQMCKSYLTGQSQLPGLDDVLLKVRNQNIFGNINSIFITDDYDNDPSLVQQLFYMGYKFYMNIPGTVYKVYICRACNDGYHLLSVRVLEINLNTDKDLLQKAKSDYQSTLELKIRGNSKNPKQLVDDPQVNYQVYYFKSGDRSEKKDSFRKHYIMYTISVRKEDMLDQSDGYSHLFISLHANKADNSKVGLHGQPFAQRYNLDQEIKIGGYILTNADENCQINYFKLFDSSNQDVKLIQKQESQQPLDNSFFANLLNSKYPNYLTTKPEINDGAYLWIYHDKTKTKQQLQSLFGKCQIIIQEQITDEQEFYDIVMDSKDLNDEIQSAYFEQKYKPIESGKEFQAKQNIQLYKLRQQDIPTKQYESEQFISQLMCKNSFFNEKSTTPSDSSAPSAVTKFLAEQQCQFKDDHLSNSIQPDFFVDNDKQQMVFESKNYKYQSIDIEKFSLYFDQYKWGLGLYNLKLFFNDQNNAKSLVYKGSNQIGQEVIYEMKEQFNFFNGWKEALYGHLYKKIFGTDFVDQPNAFNFYNDKLTAQQLQNWQEKVKKIDSKGYLVAYMNVNHKETGPNCEKGRYLKLENKQLKEHCNLEEGDVNSVSIEQNYIIRYQYSEYPSQFSDNQQYNYNKYYDKAEFQEDYGKLKGFAMLKQFHICHRHKDDEKQSCFDILVKPKFSLGYINLIVNNDNKFVQKYVDDKININQKRQNQLLRFNNYPALNQQNFFVKYIDFQIQNIFSNEKKIQSLINSLEQINLNFKGLKIFQKKDQQLFIEGSSLADKADLRVTDNNQKQLLQELYDETKKTKVNGQNIAIIPVKLSDHKQLDWIKEGDNYYLGESQSKSNDIRMHPIVYIELAVGKKGISPGQQKYINRNWNQYSKYGYVQFNQFMQQKFDITSGSKEQFIYVGFRTWVRYDISLNRERQQTCQKKQQIKPEAAIQESTSETAVLVSPIADPTTTPANPTPANPTPANPTKTPANPTPANPTPANPTPANPTKPLPLKDRKRN